MQNLSDENKWMLYAALNLSLWMVLFAGAAISGGSLARLPYIAVLFALCLSPLPFVGRLNGRYAMLGVATAAYFVQFGLLDAVSMFSPPKLAPVSEGIFDSGEAVIVVAVAMQIVGFHIGSRLTGNPGSLKQRQDWPYALLLPIGLLLWSLGSMATTYQALIVQADNSNAAVAAGFTKLGVWQTSALVLVCSYAGPLGIVILSYWWAVSDRRSSDILMLILIVAQLAVGWVADTKEVVISAPIVMLLTRFVALGRVPVRWLVCSILGIVLVFPVLTAKRAIMTADLHLTRVQALPRTAEILWRAIAERNTAQEGKYEDKTQSFLERATAKGSIETFVARVGKDKPYKMGATLTPLLYVLIPRLLWSDKPGDNSAQTFNREFHLSEDPDTYMSPSHLGELYWNFGFVGVVVGMGLVGTLLGFVCARFDLSVQTSLTRVLVIIVTLYELVARTEGQIEIQYVLWARTLLLIGILHWLLARPVQQRKTSLVSSASDPGQSTASNVPIRFPNLIR